MTSKLFGKGDGAFTVQEPTPSAGFRELRITYVKQMNFLFTNGPTIKGGRAPSRSTSPPDQREPSPRIAENGRKAAPAAVAL